MVGISEESSNSEKKDEKPYKFDGDWKKLYKNQYLQIYQYTIEQEQMLLKIEEKNV